MQRLGQMLKTQHLSKEDIKSSSNAYAAHHSLRVHPVVQKLVDITLPLPESIMLGSLDELQLFQNILRSTKAKKTLDIGVFTGVSALAVALALPEDGKVVACDISDKFPKMGMPFWKEAGVDHKIDFRCAPAVQTLEKLLKDGEADTYDFAFIDADKTGYDAYYELCLRLVRSGGIIAFDNTLWGGRVMNEEFSDPDTVALREISKKVHKDERVYCSFLVLGDGVTLAFKK